MLICDTHADTLWAKASAEFKTRRRPVDVTLQGLTADPRHTRLQVLALYINLGGMDMKPDIASRELAVLESMKKEGFRQVTRVGDAQPGQANVMLSIENCAAFQGRLENVERFARLGVRLAGLIWNDDNGIAHPAMTGSAEGLTPFGREVVKRMRECHMAVDISHLNVRGSEEVFDSDIPGIATHSCAYRLCSHARNLTDAQLKMIFRAGGYVGVNFYTGFLNNNEIADLDTVVDHIAYMCDLGGEDCVGIGSDFDGITGYPTGLENCGDVPKLIDVMRRRGFPEELVEKIMGKNFSRYMDVIGGPIA